MSPKTFSIIAAPAGHKRVTASAVERSLVPSLVYVCECGHRCRTRADLAAHHNLERMLGAPR